MLTQHLIEKELTVQVNLDSYSYLPLNNEIVNFINAGKTLIEVRGTVSLNSDRKTIEFIRFLRDVTSYGCRIDWSGIADSYFPIDLISHLYPPISMKGIDIDKVNLWQQSYRFGQFYLRKGPNFLNIMDKRNYRSPLTYTIGDPVIYSLFEKLNMPVALNDNELTEIENEALNVLLHHKLAISNNNYVIGLPYRIHKWPV
ncbi:hypothetical protein FHE72_01100 [Rossellomorea vietnamensis]|uniref:Uncharacterized protein n=1 Tax=Rossellomorea vietnamensis TaxID=218284 RepID=A0A6I6UMK5_9BACI|nr:DUF5825 family protein [Rossellomorea vietnamensis]QHE59790.1 hypothetical protein FHE72_01100 [Rossellomorea vietnamensis]